MAYELAEAYVNVIASSKGLGEDIIDDVDQSSQKAGYQGGKSLIGKMGSVVKTGAIAVGAAAVAGIAGAMHAGFNRVTSIENATAKLEGLGHSAESVETIMGNALASVKGTAFGMDEAATTAAGAVAAGIQPGQELEENLRLVADAATIAGTDMGSMGAIFNKVATSNKLQGDVINQLHDQGIPVLQLVADEMGITAEEAQDLASKGQISFETFSNAMEEGLGGAALASGDTITGALSNLKASFSRFGAEIMGPLMPIIGDVARRLTDMFDEMAPSVTAFMEQLAPIVGEVLNAFLDVLPALSPLFEALGDVFLAIAPILPPIAQLFAQIAGVFAGVLGAALSALAPVLGRIVEMLAGALMDAMPVLVPILEMAGSVFLRLLGAVLPLIEPLLALLAPILGLIEPLLQLVGVLLPPLIDLFFMFLQPVLDIATGLLSFLAPAIGFVVDILATLIGWVADAIGWFIDWVTGAEDAGAGFETAIGDAIENVLQWFADLPGKIGEFFAGIGDWLVDSGKQLIQGFIDGIVGMASNIGDAVGGLLDGVRDWFPFSPAKKGPFSGRGYVTYSGRALGQDFAEAIAGEVPAASLAAESLASAVAGELSGTLSEVGALQVQGASLGGRVRSPAAVAPAVAGSRASTVQVDVHPQPGMSEASIGRAAAAVISRELRG